MSRDMKLKGCVYIFLPEDSSKRIKANCTEVFYLKKLLNEKVIEKYGSYIQFYSKKGEGEFLKQLKEVSKRVKKDPDLYEQPNLFYIIKDIDYNISDNNHYTQLIKLLEKYYDYIDNPDLQFNVVLSSRAWETWICMYDHQYSGYGSDDAIQVIENCSLFGLKNYQKNETWYTSQENSALYDKSCINKAYENCKLERNVSFLQINDMINPDLNFQENIKSFEDIPTKVNKLCTVSTFSYVDIFLKHIWQYIK